MARSVLIVDDHPSFRATARMLLELEGYEVVGDVSDGEAALDEAPGLRPDVVLLDVNLPGIDGFETARRLLALDPAPAVVLVSSRDASEYGSLVGTSGVHGFIAKADLSGPALEEVLTT